MNKQGQIDLVTRYFAAVDGEDIDALLSTLTHDCVFTVETHGVRLEGLGEITGMFRRLWDSHAAVLHHKFTFVPDSDGNRIAARFTVDNTEHDGSHTYKSNCNFFDISGDRFSAVAVYMTGVNTLDAVT
ncbi:nuclear transport factor 2 family protein [Planktomarina temperata]|jgi:ketosteroid isomerase-like protein|uniref:nuclear transport factor 2 family protein n=1 Tax=Planktomarina temperata TaxID=1284658 RepID=UPI0023227189|nr:nuclear transport factor 2 family protein [Planktomarina temperata]MDB0007459.1 nuclear transport factor 2 family protein [Planktomarina temperata]MDB2507921.1 nuclear transport factor 2 family protein [Planktomarina temperata]MDB4854088.1 nuclear transport factor 2 family protein [Planktomarina temperata]MDB9750083.1 nuclear transport factor 2 family protein [Planktomarina temperata]